MAANIPTLFRAGRVPQFRIELALINLQLCLPSERSSGVEGRATTDFASTSPVPTPGGSGYDSDEILSSVPYSGSTSSVQCAGRTNQLSRRTNSAIEQFKFCVVLCVCHFCISLFDFLYRFPLLVTSAALVDAKGEVRKEKAKEKELNKEVKRERSCKSATQAREEVPIRTL